MDEINATEETISRRGIYLNVGLDGATVDENLDLLTTLLLGLVALVPGDNGELVLLDRGVSGPRARLNVDVEGAALDGDTIEGDNDVVDTSIGGSVVDGVST